MEFLDTYMIDMTNENHMDMQTKVKNTGSVKYKTACCALLSAGRCRLVGEFTDRENLSAGLRLHLCASANACSRLFQPSLKQGIAHDFGAAVKVELFHQSCFVCLHCPNADVEPRSDLLVGIAEGDETQDLRFALT